MPSAGSAIPFKDSETGIAVSTTAKTLITDFADFNFTLAQVQAADVALITVDGAAARYSYITTATIAIGHPIVDGGSIEIKGKSRIQSLSIVAQSGSANTFITLLTYSVPLA